MSSADDSVPTALTKQIYEELRTRTSKAQAITSGELADKLDVEDTEANPKTRELVREVMQRRDLPVVSGNSGYWVASSMKQVEREIESIDGRIASMQQRKRELVAAYNRRRYADD